MSRAFSPTDIIKQFQAAQDKAQAANTAQFDTLISTIRDLGKQTGGTFDEALSKISTLGDTARDRVEKQGQRSLAAGQQGLISSGLASSTLQQGLRSNVDESVALQQGAIDESVGAQQSGLLTQRAGNETQIGGLLANAIGNQQNQGPDLGMFASLLQSAAAAGDPNQKVTAFGGINTAALNAPNSSLQRPDADAQRAAANARQRSGSGNASIVSGSPGTSTFGSGNVGTGGPGGTAFTVGNVDATRAAAQGGVFGAGGQALSPKAKSGGETNQNFNDPCKGKGRFFPGIGCF